METDDLFRALANPIRRQILEMLLSGPRSAGEIADAFDLNRPTISEHVHFLKKCGLVTETSEGRKNIFALSPAPLLALQQWLFPFERYWRARLTDLKTFLDKETSDDESSPD